MSERRKIEDAKSCLIALAIDWVARWSDHDPGDLLADLPANADERLQPYRVLLAGSWSPTEPGAPLLSIFSRVRDPDRQAEVPQRYWQPTPLSLEEVPRPVEKAQAGHVQDRTTLWEGFQEEAKQLLRLPIDADARFEAFTHLLHKWAWAVPCRYGEPGVSLYDEFRAMSAVVHASGCAAEPAGEFLLVGGDIPGIQDFVYTITSKGAAKGLRGRSFFLQLLSDAVVRRLRAELELPECNVVYAAGGNFVLLAPAGARTREVVDQVRRQVNARLVEAIQGDTALVLEAVPVSANDLFTPARFKQVRDDLARRLAEAKNRPLRELADGWAVLFEPKGQGSDRSCAVCRIEVDDDTSKPLERTGEATEGVEAPRICYLCDSFAALARDIRHEELWMTVDEKWEMLDTRVQPRDGWADLLSRMTGFDYQFSDKPPKGKGTVLALNRPDFLEAGAQGFRLLANVTPRTTQDDIRYLREKAKSEERDMPEEGDIRSFALLAHAAATAGAIERVGVLRMDVDGLGYVFGGGVPDLTMPALSALSGALDRFFSGYLNGLVRAQAENDLYIIYAGGDDLFLVGAWHHLPNLAANIRNEFKAFVGDNPLLSLSGGVTLEGAKFPLYRAAERAEEAEARAKRYIRPDGRRKDAFCFLDTVVDWEEWAWVQQWKDEILWLIGAQEDAKGERRLPRALLQVVQSLHQLYRAGLRDARRRIRRENRKRPPDKKLPLPDPQMFFGRWTWMQAYSLTRLRDRSKDEEVKARLKELQKQLMRPDRVRVSGLAARWAEYLTRGSERQEGRSEG